MKKDWLKDIHDRMADFETDAPQGLWDDICAAEATAKGTPVIVPQKKDYRIWIGSSAAVAACLLLYWFIRPDLDQISEIPSLPSQEIASTDHRTPIENKVLPVDSKQKEQLVIAAATSGKKNIHSLQTAANNYDSLMQADEVKPSESKMHSEPKKHSEPKQEESLKRYKYLAQTSPKKRNSDPHFSVGLSTSGGIGSDNRQLFQGGYAASSSTLSESDWVDSPLLGIMALNRGAETERKVTHHAPIRTGLSFSYHLNDRWSTQRNTYIVQFLLFFDEVGYTSLMEVRRGKGVGDSALDAPSVIEAIRERKSSSDRSVVSYFPLCLCTSVKRHDAQ